jgi:hypothetical protein
MLSLTGVVIWAKKRKQRVLGDSRDVRAARAPESNVAIRAEPSA